MSTEFYLQTRGKTIDYRFLYKSPRTDWWLDYAEYILFEDRTIILERLSNEKGRLYLSGIPSKHRDRVNTVIRYTLVTEFDQGSELRPLVEEFLKDCREDGKKIAKLLDKISEEAIEDALRSLERSDKKHKKEISEKMKHLIKTEIDNRDLHSQDEKNVYENGFYWGGLKSEVSCRNWLSLVNQILNGEPGAAALLNAVSEKSLPSLEEKFIEKKIENAFILLPDSDAKPNSIQKSKISSGELVRNPAEFLEEGRSKLEKWRRGISSYLQTSIYVGVGVLFSALIFLVFMLVR